MIDTFNKIVLEMFFTHIFHRITVNSIQFIELIVSLQIDLH